MRGVVEVDSVPIFIISGRVLRSADLAGDVASPECLIRATRTGVGKKNLD